VKLEMRWNDRNGHCWVKMIAMMCNNRNLGGSSEVERQQ
jgi:hypothetical protein